MEKISYRIGQIIAIAILIFSLWALVKAILFSITFFNNLPTLDTVIIVALVSGTISIASTIAKFIWERQQQKREYLTQKREEPYEQFVAIIYKIVKNKDQNYPELENDILTLNKCLSLWGSKNVVKSWSEFILLSFENTDRQKLLDKSEEILNHMRNDLGVKKQRIQYYAHFSSVILTI
ncbi:hypothetical protein HMPREF9960_1332 [Streptococcus cristatus ATCC 51100]|uniref:Uncharacterized protein n=1 Tax=Streptococcus cristatus ATCC 51100 TaxID=889201 RepID=A0AAV3ED55_STRCR|nr:hypothetical protein [Streptococcus cristatus]EGU66711.1 hypothetical protein HMPREF9960_1332 [Streptococcus cristatus ATCC 51100]